MALEVVLGDARPVTLKVTGHSAVNGAMIPEGSTVAVTSSDPTVATVADVVVPAGGASDLSSPVTVLAAGSTDFGVTVTTPDGGIFTGSATLTVSLPPPPPLASITVDLIQG